MSSSSPLAIEVHGDIVEIRPGDAFDLAWAEHVIAAVDAARTRHPRVFLLAAAGGSRITPEARRFITDWLRTSPFRLETAVWGGGTMHRAIGEMIARSVHFFRPGGVHIHFHRSRDEALAWIDAQRRKPPPA